MRIRHAFASPFGRSTRPAPGLGHRRSRYGGWPWDRAGSPTCHGRRYGKRRRKDLLSDVAQQHRRLVCRGKASTAKERERRPPISHSSLARFHQAPAGIGKAWNGYLERPSIRRVEQGADHLRSTLERLPSSAPTVPENVYTAHLSIRLSGRRTLLTRTEKGPHRTAGATGRALTRVLRAGACTWRVCHGSDTLTPKCAER
jgi:hypothetical protein